MPVRLSAAYGHALLTLLLWLGSSSTAWADEPKEGPARSQTIAAVDRELAELRGQLKANLARREKHNQNPPDPKNKAAVDTYNAQAAAGKAEFDSLKALYLVLKAHRTALQKKPSGRAANLPGRAAARAKQIRDLELAREQALEKLRAILRRHPAHARALREWGTLPGKARREARGKALASVLDLVLLDQKLKINGSALQKQTQVRELQSQLLKPKASPAALREVRQAVSELQKIRSRAELVSYFEKSRSWAALAKQMDERQQTEAVATILKMTVRHPSAQLLLSDVELLTAVGYAHTAGRLARRQVDVLDRLSESQLTEARIYGQAVKRYTDALQRSRR